LNVVLIPAILDLKAELSAEDHFCAMTDIVRDIDRVLGTVYRPTPGCPTSDFDASSPLNVADAGGVRSRPTGAASATNESNLLERKHP
jgi:hypothetical protein